MDGTFDIRVDPERDLIRMRLCGFFDEALLDRLLAARIDAREELRCAPTARRVIVDLRDIKIQAQTIVARFAAVLANPDRRSRRLAIVIGRTLARQQLLRVVGSRLDGDVAIFTDPAEAEAWVSDDRNVIAA